MQNKNLGTIVGLMLSIALFSGLGIVAANLDTNINLTLSPLTATNPIDTMHTVTAQVTELTANGTIPISNLTVRFNVLSGPNNGTNGTNITNASGQAIFTYQGIGGAGVDIIQAFVLNLSIPSNTVNKTWVQDHVFNVGLTLSPLKATNPVDTTHTVTAQISDLNGTPIPIKDVEIDFLVLSGPNNGTNGNNTTDGSGKATFTYSDSGWVGLDIIQASANFGRLQISSNKVEKEWVGTTEGFMTGGGSTFEKDGTKVTHGFELQCNIVKSQNNLEVNWDNGNKFHLDSLIKVACIDDKSIEPNPPKAGFDTYIGSGKGSYNGLEGATATWVFTDIGEHGNKDTAEIHITDVNGNVVLTASGKLDKGNQQAHK